LISQGSQGLILDFLNVLEYWDHILGGFLSTMWLYIWALFIGFILGLLLALLRQYGGRILSRISAGYIEIIRGTPLLVQLFLIYFTPYSINAILEAQNIPTIPIGGWNYYVIIRLWDKSIVFIFLNYQVLIGILVLGLNSAAYQAEYFRGSLISVGSGQLIAAQSLGFSKIGGIRHIVLPQALRRVIPAWSNEAVYLPKYTVVVFYIGVVEHFAQAHYIVTETFLSLPTYLIIAAVFLITITIISKGLDFLYTRKRIPGL
jgi:polar amino acid transport system permease protein